MKIIANMHRALSFPVTTKPSHAEILLPVQMRRNFYSSLVKLFTVKHSLHLSLLNINTVKHSHLLAARSKRQTSSRLPRDPEGKAGPRGLPPHPLHSAGSTLQGSRGLNPRGKSQVVATYCFTEISWISGHKSDWMLVLSTQKEISCFDIHAWHFWYSIGSYFHSFWSPFFFNTAFNNRRSCFYPEQQDKATLR